MALASFCGYDRLCIKNSILGDLDGGLMPQSMASMWSDSCSNFDMPSVADPKSFVKTHFEATSTGLSRKMHFLKGTTTLAFVYEPATNQDSGGIIVAVDSRASSGNYISSATCMKVLEITEDIVGTLAGGAADCQFWLRNLSRQCRLYELQNKDKLSVAAASKLLANMLYNYKGMGLSMATMIAGYDKRGACLYYVDDNGNRVQGNLFSCGSGSLNAYGILDTNVKKVMTDQEAIELGQKAIMHATYRDCGSGGSCRVFHITKQGQKHISTTDVNELTYDHFASMQKEPYEPSL